MRLRINNLNYEIAIGVTEQEQLNPQQILISLEFEFNEIPLVCNTDQIRDTLCYDVISQKIFLLINKRKFHTIEYLAQECLRCVCDFILDSKLSIRQSTIYVTKSKPAIAISCENVMVILTSNNS